MKFSLKKYNGTLFGVAINLLLVVGIFFTLMFVYFYVYLPSATNHGETITVPNIEGMSVDKLDEFLVERNLQYEVNDSSFSDDYPPLTVLKQYPAAGAKVKEERKIFISINRINPPTVPLPNIIESSLVNAEVVLRSNELKRGHIELVPGPYVHLVKRMKFQGKEMNPGDRVPKGSAIDLVVQDGGTDKFNMPNVMGYTMEDAEVSLYGSDLNIAPVHVVGDTTGNEPIVVIKQKPLAEENIKAGDIVEIWIGKSGTPTDDIEDEP